MSIAVGASFVAHTLHYAILAAGFAGLAFVLGPHLSSVARRDASAPYDEHERRVRELRRQLESTLRAGANTGPPRTGPPRTGRPGTLTVESQVESGPHEAITRPPALKPGELWIPLAVVSSAAAAGVHAAVGPAHFDEGFLFGSFFAAAATLQVVWASAMVVRPSVRLLKLAAVGNAAVIGLWLVTRTLGLPFGLLPQPEELGAWDLASGCWEFLVVVSCLRMLRSVNPELRFPALPQWHQAARWWAVTSAVGLAALSLSGASA